VEYYKIQLNTTTNDEALADLNGLYFSMADDFQSHDSVTKSITGLYGCFTICLYNISAACLLDFDHSKYTSIVYGFCK
jgi:hypothetical protein